MTQDGTGLLNCSLYRYGRNILAAGRDDQLLLPASDVEEACLRVDVPYVACVEEPFGVYDIKSCLRVIEIAHENVPALYADLSHALFVRVEDLDLCPWNRSANLIKGEKGWLHVCCSARGLTKSVSVDQWHAKGHEELFHLAIHGCRTEE